MPALSLLQELAKRHEGHEHGHGVSHHYDNLIYGYCIFVIFDLGYPVYLWVIQRLYHRRWSQTGRSTKFIRLVTFPLSMTVLIWSCIILFLGIWNYKEDVGYSVHIKRFGRVAYVLMPLDIFLSFRPSPIPMNHYLDLLVIHKWLSRLIIASASLHSIFYFAKWANEGTLSKSFRIFNLIGIINFGLFAALAIVSIKVIRRKLYKFFYLFHMITVWATVFIISLHARPGVNFYFIICLLLLCYQIGLRIKTCNSICNLSVLKPERATLSLVSFPKSSLQCVYSPASHLRISYPLTSFKSWIYPTHPYTIASLPQDNDIKLIVKETDFKLEAAESYAISGPYEALPLNFFQTAENVCIICGGSGISYGLPIYNHFKKNNIDFLDVKLVWVTRNKEDLYLLKELNVQGVDIYITSQVEEPVKEERSIADETDNELDQFLIEDPDSDSGDMRNSMDSFDYEANPFNDPKSVIESSAKMYSKNLLHYGTRPNLDVCFKRNLSRTADNANKWIVACGNESLIKDAKLFAKQNGTRFVAEVYAM